ncbi:uncharacterized protein LOC112637409 [Camponotus floridanus]|uniref:uncharacterized protein LOC112637409 n=1 Tax=Camponotus floridanus TaxID=104421 RepID=UPI000DC67A24|nr:uncharacterized protein LOC112637409 [Camponotus floridanus]
MNDSGFIIAEFDDGLQLIPTIWFNAEKQSCIWPGHFKTKFRINKAIITKEIPQEEFDWDELPIKRIFGTADTYEKGMEKLVLAQDTSNIENTEISSNELKEIKKKRRRIQAKKKMSSSEMSSSSEDFLLQENKENRMTQNNKILPAFPQIEHFVPNYKSRDKCKENFGNELSERNSTYNRINIVHGKQLV